MRTIYLLLFFISFSAVSQTIEVLDLDTREPIIGVAIFNKDKSKSALTDFDGKADISAFAKAEVIFFKEIAHKETQYTKAQIQAFSNRIFLKQKDNQLGEIVLSASKFAQRKKNIPQKIVGISSEVISRLNPQTAADLLQSSGAVFVQKSQQGGGSPLIRGFSTNRLLITLDGVRFNTAIFRGGNVQNVISLDPFSIDRTEVLLGPGSVIYGSDAVGGVMNFYTKKPTLTFSDSVAIHGTALFRANTANKERTGHFDINFGKDKWAFLTSASYSDYDNQRQGSNGPDDYLRLKYAARIDGQDVEVVNDDPLVQEGSSFSSMNLMQKVRYAPNQLWDISFDLHYATTSNYDRYDRLTRERDGQLRAAEWYYGPQKWLMANAQVTKEGDGTIYNKAQATLTYQNSQESRNDRNFNSTEFFETDENVDAYSTGVDFTKNLANRKNKLFYGLEYIYNRVNSYGQVTDITTGNVSKQASRYPNGSNWSSVAGYVSTQLAISSKTKLQSGLRYNQVWVNADFTENNEFFDLPFNQANISTGNLTGSLGVTHELSKSFTVIANVGTAFRAPNIDDVGKIFDSEPGSVVVPNPDLKAEYAYNSEIGVKYKYKNKIDFTINGYYTLLDNALVRQDYDLDGVTQIEYQGELSNVQAIQNASKAEVYGLEVALNVRLNKDLKFTSRFNYTNGVEQDEGGDYVPVRHVAPIFGDSHFIWSKKKWTVDTYLSYSGKFDFEDLAPSQQNNTHLYALDNDGNPFSPSWYTFNIASQYMLSDHWSFTANLENITDQRYRTYSSGISAAGRNLILSAKYSF
ncbi:TonB-dependent receptor plug domain-containing protein [Dokdonia sp. Hel_I_53]|uniref:TonB-dependent receptor plug domain-containing protein n=1 Tax=Dokdonia sp. Hel_I_53 TaxID=1566287 RepID=UPI00119B5237|nr:TonB-dependent receptor [Dokdonia sp. Hel_I_53]TVZ52786.1 hemoglobin/transferrin/lactoferrin receptor protein [Dokdonia sp. Hel_I_53]